MEAKGFPSKTPFIPSARLRAGRSPATLGRPSGTTMEERLAAAVARQERTAERAQRLESLVEGLLARIETLEGLPRPNKQGLLARLGALEGQVEGLSTRQDAPSTLAVQEYERLERALEADTSFPWFHPVYDGPEPILCPERRGQALCSRLGGRHATR